MVLRFQQLLCFCTGLLVFTACSERADIPEEIIRPVRYEQVSSQNANRVLAFTGITKANEETELSFKVGGTITELKTTPGQRIKKGDLIASLDESDAKLEYDKQLLALEKAKAQMETARSNLGRVKGLYENNNVPLGDYEVARESFSNTDANYQTEKRATDLARRKLEYYELHCPTDGIVLDNNVSINENIQAGQVILVLQSGNTLAVEVGMPEQFIAQIEVGQTTSIKLPSIENRSFLGNVSEVAYNVNPDSSNYPVTVTIENASNAIRPGMPARVEFQFAVANSKELFLVPLHSVSKDEGGNYVFVVIDAGQGIGEVKKVPVKIGRMTNEGFEIIEGIQEGDNVITAGISSLTSGMRVSLLR